MLSRLIFGVTSVLAQEQHRELAGGATSGVEVDLVDFDMDYTSNEGYKFHFANYGHDWGHIYGLDDEDNFCKAEILSPINLMEPIGSYGWAYGYPKAKIDDLWNSTYVNDNDVLVEWDYSKIQVTFTQDNAAKMFMESNFAETLFGGKAKRF